MSLTLTNAELQESTRAFLQDSPKKLLVGGQWEEARSGETFVTRNPATGEALAEVAAAGEADVGRAVSAARAALDGPWGRMSGADRARVMQRLARLIEGHADELAELDTLDNGKPLRVARQSDVPLTVRHFRYYAGWADKIEGATIPVAPPDQLVYTVREPVGVVGLIVPWNYPLLMTAWKVAPALACGNAIILKPAEQTPLSALRLGQLMLEAGVPPGAFNVLTGFGVPAGAALAAHPGVDKVGFTGSTEVGRKVMAAAAGSNLKRVSLELGGKAPNVIFADADLEMAVEGATWAVFGNTGQSCTAGARLYVQSDVYDRVVPRLAERARSIKVGSGFMPDAEMGPVISEAQLQRILEYVEQGRRDGIELLAGGRRLEGELAGGYFLPPTVFCHEPGQQSPLIREEVFGPLVAVTRFEAWDEVLQQANDTRYGLAAGIWTRDVGKAHRFARAVKAGTVWINTWGQTDPAAPFGGYKESGFGREMGKEALDLYTEVKTVWAGL